MIIPLNRLTLAIRSSVIELQLFDLLASRTGQPKTLSVTDTSTERTNISACASVQIQCCRATLQKKTSTGKITLTQNVTDTFLLTFTKRLNIGQHSLTTLGACRLCVKKFYQTQNQKTAVTHERRVIRKSVEPDNPCTLSSGLLTDYQAS